MDDIDNTAAERINALIACLSVNDDNVEEVLLHIKSLRSACAKSPIVQNNIAANSQLIAFIKKHLNEPVPVIENHEKLQLLLWQLLANTVVNNCNTQRIIAEHFGDHIKRRCVALPLGRLTEIPLMMLYNFYLGDSGCLSDSEVMNIITQLWQTIIDEMCDGTFEFLHFFYEHFLVEKSRRAVQCYAGLESAQRMAFLDYVASYLRNDSPNGNIGDFLLTYISKEFKMKSDYILRQSASDVEQAKPREAYSLLRIIAIASGSEKYAQIYSKDHALFLNVSSLLRCLVAAGKAETKSIFTPMNKLEEVAVTSEISPEFEREISFELKTLLVRCVANLLYKNPTNKGYCIDTQLMPALLECTNMDARNPLIREWSILAIRNGCMDCPEIQATIANLTNQGMVQNDIVNELNLDMGSLRIQTSK